MLWRLLLVHGRWNYMRISEMILYFFYKNMLFTIPQFIFAFYCGFSGQTIFDDIYISLYNLVFTSLPLVIRAILEQDVYFIQPAKPAHSALPLPDQSEARIPTHQMDTAYAEYIPNGFEVNKYLYRLFPKIYFIGQQNCIFNYRNFALWASEAVVEAVIITFFSLYILSETSVSSGGHSTDMWLASLTMYSSPYAVSPR
jgi:magnesium-transporting ATPase (P-type)